MVFILFGLALVGCAAAVKLFPDHQFILDIAFIGIVAAGLVATRWRRGLLGSITDWSFLRSRKSMIGLALIAFSAVALIAGVLRAAATGDGAPPWLMLLLLPILPLFLVGCSLVIQEVTRVTPHDELWSRPPWKRRP